MVIRLFISSVSEGDVDQVLELLREDVVPAFEAHPDCLGIDIFMAEESNLGGLVEGGVITRWTSEEAMEAALDDLKPSQERVLPFLRREPVRRIFRVMT